MQAFFPRSPTYGFMTFPEQLVAGPPSRQGDLIRVLPGVHGSLNIYIQHKLPEGQKAANWLPRLSLFTWT
jgi:hypothetical protein